MTEFDKIDTKHALQNDPAILYILKWLNLQTPVQPVMLTSYSVNILEAAQRYISSLTKEIIYLNEENGSFRIKETRELLSKISRTPFSDQRLIIIHRAERLTMPAANALLKSLEESTGHNKWLLTTGQLPLILPTIRSRCQILRINQSHNDQPPVSGEFWQGLSSGKRGDSIDDKTLETLHVYLTELLKERGVNPNIYRALLRLRDYHKIKCHRGNTKLARDVLLASLYQLRNN